MEQFRHELALAGRMGNDLLHFVFAKNSRDVRLLAGAYRNDQLSFKGNNQDLPIKKQYGVEPLTVL
jgi:hypothetical protein